MSSRVHQRPLASIVEAGQGAFFRHAASEHNSVRPTVRLAFHSPNAEQARNTHRRD